MDHQAGVAGLDLVQDLRHRVVAGVDDADAQRRGGAAVLLAACAARSACARICRASTRNTTPAAVSATWWVLRPAGGRPARVQPLHLLAQRRLDDVLPLGRPAEVQLLRQRHEVAKLPKLHARRQFRI